MKTKFGRNPETGIPTPIGCCLGVGGDSDPTEFVIMAPDVESLKTIVGVLTPTMTINPKLIYHSEIKRLDEPGGQP